MRTEISAITGAITLISESAGERELLEMIARGKKNYCGEGIVRGPSSTVISFIPKGIEQTETLAHIPSQQQAAKVASYYAELYAHHLPFELVGQLTLEYQRMEMENA